MKNDEEGYITLDAENEADDRFDAYSYDLPASRRYSASAFNEEKDNDVICIGSTTIHDTSSSSNSRVVHQSTTKKRVTFAENEEENDEIEWITSTKNEPTPCNSNSNSSTPNVFYIDDEMDDCNYSLQIKSPYADSESNVVDVELEYSADANCSRNPTCTRSIDSTSPEPAEISGSTIVVSAVVHAAPSSPSSPVASSHNDSVPGSEIDDYDARMRACFGLDLDRNISSVETELNRTADSVDVSTSRTDIECNESANENVFEIKDESEDDCVITGMELNPCSDTELKPCSDTELKPCSDTELKPCSDTELNPCSDTKSNISGAADDVKTKTESKKNITSETVDEIFKRMMPSAVPGVLSLFAPDRKCRPRNIRTSKFRYFYFVSSHIVVKEITKHEFYKFKDEILIPKKSNAPPRCKCLTHPLNKNASKLTLITNPYSIYHNPNCHFSSKSRNDPAKRKGIRRLYTQVSFRRVPQKRDGKDFKDWSDIVIRKRLNANSNRTSWPPDDGSRNENKIVRHSLPPCKNEPMNFDCIETITSKSEC